MLRAAAFAVPILVVFGALLASADEVFSTLISRRFDAEFTASRSSGL